MTCTAPLPAWLALACLIGACAAPVPREPRLGALEQRVAAQRTRTAAIDRGLLEFAAGSPPSFVFDESTPHYQLVTFRSGDRLGALHAPALRMQLAKALAEGGVTALEYRGIDGSAGFVPPWTEDAQFPGLPVAVLFAATHAAAARFRGAEFDMRVPLEPGPDRLVTILHDLDGRIAAADALAPAEQGQPAGSDPAALRARYGIGAVEGWSAAERASLARALALLQPAEIEALRGIPFWRKGRASGLLPAPVQGRHCGHFQLDDRERSITIYDCAFETDAHAFVGPLDRPLAPSVRVILHEIAHALAAGSLAAVLADVRESQREARAMVDEFNRLGRNVSPEEIQRLERLQQEIEALQASLVRWHERIQALDHLSTAAVRAFLDRPGASAGFTPYGRSHPVEAYAEAFSLCRTDVEAGERIAPGICAYFNSGAYLESGRE